MKIIVAAVSIILTACSSSTPVTWEARCDELVPGEYRACYGPGWDRPSSGDRPYENFQVSLERKYKTSSHVIVSAKFPANKVPPHLLTRYPPSVVTFDRASGRVAFTVGAETVVGRVP